MDKVFFVDTNVIKYSDLISIINGNVPPYTLSDIEFDIINMIKTLVDELVLDYDDLILKINQKNPNISLSTSGTTGTPKKINHTFTNMIKNIKISSHRIDDVWGFAYTPNKMAAYQVLFQAFLNKNTLINLYKCDDITISERIEKYGITHLSATPTFYKLLVSGNKIYENIKQISFGGEGSDLETQNKIKLYFPNAKVKNIYASTEVSSLFATSGEYFKIPKAYSEFIDVNSNTLKVHKSLVGDIGSDGFDNDWYDTGDLIEVIDSETFKIIGRTGSLINVGGHTLNLINIESKIATIDYVKICKVYSKSNSILGNIVICDIVLNDNIVKAVYEIKKDISTVLNDYEVPTKINLVDSIKINDSGKIDRK